MLAAAIFALSCSSDDSADDNQSSVKVDGQKYTYEHLLMSDASDFPLSDADAKTTYFYLVEPVPCSGAPCSRPVGMSITIVQPLGQTSLEGTYQFTPGTIPRANVYDHKSQSQSGAGSVTVTRLDNGEYELRFSEDATLVNQGFARSLKGKVKGNFEVIPFDYRTGNGQTN